MLFWLRLNYRSGALCFAPVLIEKVWARDMWDLTSRLNRKLLAHTISIATVSEPASTLSLLLVGVLGAGLTR